MAFSGDREKVRPVSSLRAVVVVSPGIIPKRIPAWLPMTTYRIVTGSSKSPPRPDRILSRGVRRQRVPVVRTIPDLLRADRPRATRRIHDDHALTQGCAI